MTIQKAIVNIPTIYLSNMIGNEFIRSRQDLKDKKVIMHGAKLPEGPYEQWKDLEVEIDFEIEGENT